MYTVKAKPIYKYRVRCASCGSEDIIVHAECYWDFDAQEWKFSEWMDGMDDWCGNCQCETNVEDVREEVKPEWP